MPSITVRYTGCENVKTIPLGPMQPFCEYCGSPCVAVKVNAGGRKKKGREAAK